MSLIPSEPNPVRNPPRTKGAAPKGRKAKPESLKLHPLMLALPREVIESLRAFDDSGKRSAALGARWVIYSFFSDGPTVTQKVAWLGDVSDEEASKILTLAGRLGKESEEYEAGVRERKRRRQFWQRLSKEKRAEVRRRLGGPRDR